MDNDAPQASTVPITPVISPSVAAADTAAPALEYAGFWRRLGASIIDGFILTLVNLSIGFSLGLGGMKPGGLLGLVSFLIGVGYVIFFWVSQNGQTLGKRAMAVRVVKDTGEPLDWETAIVRYIGYIISSIILFLGFIWVAFDSKKQGWHDKIAKTYVVKTAGKPKTWLAVLLTILPILLFFIFIFTIAGLAASGKISETDFAQIFTPNFTKQFQNVDSATVKRVFGETALAVEKYRKDNGFPTSQNDKRLCAYAKRRLEQLSAFTSANNWYDNGKGFYEDIVNPSIQQAYFLEYLNVFESVAPMNGLLTGDRVLEKWGLGNESNISNKNITYYCIEADEKHIIFIGVG